ncbi:aminotransferase class III-fold pyridoxal phosphate-dependent enzyme [Chondromyces crocatus]|uniref:4-aminobutyrate aminotransferase n=1 Tax=Chondromyces crocatus TaxID=52 RepID=A0A0K1E7Y6_CHOCO|nr:aminotransferase class III-fold pyridoxal phosphate-dependent enzyme [Chondromyces crocatus]AKT36974.1 4-aminobutyrate aminotransferase [Chondromyces crocatus]
MDSTEERANAASPRQVVTDLPGPKARALMARGTFDMQSRYRAVVMDEERSQGCWLADVDGNVFLDLFANFALGALGYNHPALLEVARSHAFAAAAANPTSTPFIATPAWFDFIQAMEQQYAPRGMGRIFCVDAGGEGVEAALKAAFIQHGERQRVAAGRPANPLLLPDEEQQAILQGTRRSDAVVVSFSGAFHGRGLGPLSATHSKVIHKADLPSFPWPVAPFPANRFPRERHEEHNLRLEAEALAELSRILDQHAGKVAAILVEPVQSEGGDRHASPAFFQRVQALAAEAGAAFILDEVQTGMGITGTLWAHEQLALPRPPDLVCFGKKMQMGGFFAAPAHDISQFGRMYQTRNGDRTRAALALATLRTIDAENLLTNVTETGAYFLAQLQGLAERYPDLVTEPRGRGFLLAFDLPTPATRDDFLARCQRQGVFATYTGTRSVRLRPHLITRQAEVDEAVSIFDATLREMTR